MNINKKHGFMDELTPDEVAAIKAAIAAKHSMQKIADMIQDEFKKCLDKTPEALRKSLSRYALEVMAEPMDMGKEIAAISKPSHLSDLAKQRENLMRVRLKRVQWGLQHEQIVGRLDPEITKELKHMQDAVEKALHLY